MLGPACYAQLIWLSPAFLFECHRSYPFLLLCAAKPTLDVELIEVVLDDISMQMEMEDIITYA